MAVPAVLGCHPLIGWRALQSWASVGLFQLSTKGVKRGDEISWAVFKKKTEQRGETLLEVSVLMISAAVRLFFLAFWKQSWTFRRVMRLIRVFACDFEAETCTSVH